MPRAATCIYRAHLHRPHLCLCLRHELWFLVTDMPLHAARGCNLGECVTLQQVIIGSSPLLPGALIH